MGQQAISLDDSLATAHSALAQTYTVKAQYGLALAEAQRSIALDPNSATGYQGLADVLNNQGRSTDALAAVETAMRLDPRNSDNYLYEEGWAYFQLGRWREAIFSLKRCLARFPDHLWAHAYLADIYSLQDNEDGARAETAEIQRAIALSPNSAIRYLGLAQALDNQGRPAEGLIAVDKAMHLDPRSDFYSGIQGSTYTLLGRRNEAIIALKRSIARYPENFWAHAWLAVDYMESGKDDAARVEAAEVLQLNPKFAVETILPVAGMQHKAFPAETDRFRADLHKAGMP
jgi:tetratricopeptide (TPR) repeat protein